MLVKTARATVHRLAWGAACAAALVVLACAPALVPLPSAGSAPSASAPVRQESAPGRLARDRVALVALSARNARAVVTATGAWRIDEAGGRTEFVKGTGGEAWRVEMQGGRLRIAGDGSDATPWREGPFVARATAAGAFIRVDGKRYRGEVVFTPTDTGLLVVNRLPVEAYLRGVVPLEVGTKQIGDAAAIEAQAIAARSYTYMRVPGDGAPVPGAGWHLVASVQHQVYGGVDAENAVVDAAVDATDGLVLRYGGLVVDAPYFASCGGHTAGPREAWRDAKDQAWLQPVDDTDPRTGKPYCDLSPRNHWHAQFDAAQLSAAATRALEATGVRGPRAATVTGVRVAERTPSGRANALILTTERGDVRVSARDIRYVLRDARGAMLLSTYFTVEGEDKTRGAVTRLTLAGAGNGHGVGLCQWGAIGRARAGSDARAILRHYYPGTVVGYAD